MSETPTVAHKRPRSTDASDTIVVDNSSTLMRKTYIDFFHAGHPNDPSVSNFPPYNIFPFHFLGECLVNENPLTIFVSGAGIHLDVANICRGFNSSDTKSSINVLSSIMYPEQEQFLLTTVKKFSGDSNLAIPDLLFSKLDESSLSLSGQNIILIPLFEESMLKRALDTGIGVVPQLAIFFNTSISSICVLVDFYIALLSSVTFVPLLTHSYSLYINDIIKGQEIFVLKDYRDRNFE